MSTELRGGSYYRTSKGRVGQYRGVSYTTGKHVQLLDLNGKPFKAAVSTLTPVHRDVSLDAGQVTVTFTDN
jgi:hypothetical protein